MAARFRLSAILAPLFLALLAMSTPASDRAITRDDIAAAWNRRTIAARVEWRYDTTGVYRFHRYQSDWVPRDERAAERIAALEIDRSRWRFDTIRWSSGEHGYIAANINASVVVEFYPERKADLYVAALDAHFADPRAEFRDPRPFRRTFDGTTLRDYWPLHAGDYPRGIVRARLPTGGPGATASDARSISDELQDLSLAGAILALDPRHPCGPVRLEDYSIAGEPAFADGARCLVLTKAPSAQRATHRTLWLDPSQDLSIRRWIDGDPLAGTQIDIRYRRDDRMGWVPAEWTVSSFGEENGGRLDAARAIVTKLEPRAPLSAEETAIEFPAATWVIDEPAAAQYIIGADGSRRDIHPIEFDWLPTYAELAATGPGQVGPLIERKLRWNRYWRSARVPAILGITILASAAALSFWRRRKPNAHIQMSNSVLKKGSDPF